MTKEKNNSNQNSLKNKNKKIERAKKMVIRKPNQQIIKKSEKLREQRVDERYLEAVRLQKALASSGLGSRRDMEKWIEEGLVKINNHVAKLGDKVSFNDEVKVKDKIVKLTWPDRLPRILLYYKQEGEIVSRDDPQGRISVFDRLPQTNNLRWVVVGRLDINTAGLLIFTTSGELVNRLAHPRFAIDREYSVRVPGQLTEKQMNQLTSTGIELEDGIAKAAKIVEKDQTKESRNFWYEIVVQEGKNREVRRIFEHFGLTVSRLVRTRFGPIAIPPRLKKGQYYELNELEVDYVMKNLGLIDKKIRRR